MSKSLATILSAVALVTAAGFGMTACQGSAQMNAKASAQADAQGQGQATAAEQQDHADMKKRSCPMLVSGTTVTAEDTPKGAALVFTTTGDVSEVQKRAHLRADLHNKHHAPGGIGEKGEEDMPVSEAVVEDLPNGAKITIRPVDENQIEQVRKMIHKKAEKMAKMHAGS